MSYSELSDPDLVQACLRNDQAAWEEFVRRYKQVISLAVLRTARRWGDTSKPVLEDLIGDTYLKLCADDFKLLRHFEFRTEAALYGCLKVVATNVVHDYFRHRRPRHFVTEVAIEDVYEAADPPCSDGVKDIERNVLIREVEEALNEVTGPKEDRDRAIFWLHHRQGFTANAIAELGWAGLSGVKGVESVIHRLTRDVRERLTDKAAACPTEDKKGVSEKRPF